MKKVFLILIAVIGISFAANAQTAHGGTKRPSTGVFDDKPKPRPEPTGPPCVPVPPKPKPKPEPRPEPKPEPYPRPHPGIPII